MSLSIVLHPDVVSFLGDNLNSEITGNVWGCIEKMREQRFDQGLRAKKLKGISEKVWEARINKSSRLIFTYKKSIQPDTGKPQTYIAVQDICLDHDDVSRRARARKVTPDSQWLDADVVEMFGNLDSETISTVEQTLLKQMQSEDIHIGDDFYDELLGNIQWKVVDSEEEWRQAIIEGGKDLSLKLTQQEYELATKYGNFLVMGSAGTGKTTVGLYRMVNSLTQLGEGKRLYVAASPILVKESEKCFKRLHGKDSLGDVFEFKTIKQLCFDILNSLNSNYNYSSECEVTCQVFEKWYYSEYSRYDRTVYPSSLVWHEIRGIIKGASLDLDHDYLPEHKYKDLGGKRSSVISRRSDRDGIYKIAKRYKRFLEEKQLFDEIDLTRKAVGVAATNPRYQMIVCDEVQDFAELQLLLLVKLIASGGQLFFTGDLNQMILPSAFRWKDLTSILAKENINYNQPEELNTNFRSVGSLSNLSNQILKLRCDLLREQSSKGFAIVSGDFRDVARNINTSPKEISSILKDLYPDEAILVRTIEEKEKFNHLKFVFTIEEAKGLEFDTVFLVEFFTAKQNLWTKLLNQQKTSSNENVELRLEFNLLYVAITRARRVLNIWESQKAALWSREEVKPFVQSITPESARQDRIEPTQQDWLNRGIYYRDAGFYEQAIECFKKAGDEKLQIDVEVKILLQERNYSQAAELLVKLQDWKQAAQVFEGAKIWDKASDCWENAGNFVNQKKTQAKGFEFSQQWEEAALLWEKLGIQERAEFCWLKVDNGLKKIEIITNQKSYFDKSVGHYETPNKQGVIQSSNDSIKVDPNLAKSHYRKGNANYALGDNRLAIKEYNQAIKNNPNFVEAYYNRAIVRLDLGDNEGAIEDCSQAIKINPNLAEVYYNRGLAFSNLGDNQEAIKDYTKAIKINPNYSQAYVNRGLAFLDLGYNQKAIEDYNRAIKINPNNEYAYYNKGVAFYTLGQKEKAIKEYTQAIKINPNYSQAYGNRGAAFSDLGYNQKAIEDYNRAIEIDPNYCDAYYNRGNALSELGHKEEAIKDYTRAIQIDPHDALAYTGRGNIYAELGDEQNDNAVMDFQKAANAFKRQGSLQDYQDSLKAIKTIREGYKRTQISE